MGKWAYLVPNFWGPDVLLREICENIGANMYNLVHFGVTKISILNRNIQTVTSYQLVNYHLPQTSANYLVLDMIGDQCFSVHF